MRQFKAVFFAAAVGAALFSFACGEPGDDPGTGGLKQCSADADCAATEGCHPTAKVCVQTCEQASDCPTQAEKNCAAVKVNGADSAKKFCQCSTDPLCNTDGATDQVCSTLANVCVSKCAADTECAVFGSGATCDTATGQCKVAPVVTKCTADTECKTGEYCNTATGDCIKKCTQDSECTDATNKFCDTQTGRCGATQKCDPSATAIGTAGGPGVCKGGEICDATSRECKAAHGTCEAATTRGNKATANSPTVYDVAIKTTRARTTAEAGACNATTITIFEGKWYDPQGDVPTTGTYAKINRVSKAGVKAPTFKDTSVTKNADGKTGTFTFELCDDQKGTAQGVVLDDNANNESNVGCFTGF